MDLLIQNLVPLTIAFALAALVMLVGALLLRRRVGDAASLATTATRFLDEQAVTLPIMLSTARADLAERHAGLDQTLWQIERMDARVAATTAALAERRSGLDDIHDRLQDSRAGVERLKSALRMIMRAIELRRTILG